MEIEELLQSADFSKETDLKSKLWQNWAETNKNPQTKQERLQAKRVGDLQSYFAGELVAPSAGVDERTWDKSRRGM